MSAPQHGHSEHAAFREIERIARNHHIGGPSARIQISRIANDAASDLAVRAAIGDSASRDTRSTCHTARHPLRFTRRFDE